MSMMSFAFKLVRTQIAAYKEHESVHINLNSKLRTLAIDELETLFTSSEIANTNTIDVSGNELHNLGSNGLARILAAFKNTQVEILDLSDNELCLLGTKGLTDALSALQGNHVKAIDLRFNWFDLMDGDGLAPALASLKDTAITTIAFSINEMYHPRKGLTQTITALKHSKISGIRLSFILNHHIDIEKLMKVLSALKDTDINAIDLSENSLCFLNTESLAQILGAFKGTQTRPARNIPIIARNSRASLGLYTAQRPCSAISEASKPAEIACVCFSASE